jgi:hypothetical protein
MLAEHAAENWPANETEAKRRANETHGFRSLLGRRHIRNARLCRSNIASARAINDSAKEKHPRSIRRSRDEIPNRCPDDAHQQNGPAADSIRELSDQRPGYELHEGKDADEQPQLVRRQAKRIVLRINRENRNDDAEADHADEDGQEYEAQRGFTFGHASGEKAASIAVRRG